MGGTSFIAGGRDRGLFPLTEIQEVSEIFIFIFF